MDMETTLSDDILDAAEESAGYQPVPAGTYRLRVLTGKAKIIERNGIKQIGLSLAPIATAEGERVNGESIYHTLPLEGEFTNSKTGKTQSRAVFFATFFRKGLGLEREDVKAIHAQALAAAVDSEVAFTLSSGEFLDLKGAEVMGKVTVSESNGKEYRNIRSVWAAEEETA